MTPQTTKGREVPTWIAKIHGKLGDLCGSPCPALVPRTARSAHDSSQLATRMEVSEGDRRHPPEGWNGWTVGVDGLSILGRVNFLGDGH
jgi:hypothetical protein